MTRRHALALLLVLVTPAPALAEAASAPAGAEAVPVKAAAVAASAGEGEDLRIGGGEAASYMAPSGAMTSLKGLHDFVAKAADSLYDIETAARVDGFTFTKDEGKWTLTGWIIMRKPVDGVTYNARFFGDGRFEMTPPIRMEKDQVKRFLGKESVDQAIKSARFTFTGRDDQQRFESLTYTAEAAKACETDNEDCGKFFENLREYVAKGETQEAATRRRFNEFTNAVSAYERFLDPGFEGSFTAEMGVKVPEDQDKTKPFLINLNFGYDPDQLEEAGLSGQWDHGKRKPWSLISSFHAKGQYDSTSDRTASSAFAEKESKTELAVRTNKFRMVFDPGAKRDMRMKADMDCLVQADAMRYLVFYVTGLIGATKARVDGQDAEFFQPAIPGEEWLHSPFIILTVPRVLKKGETVRVELELEGKVLYNVNGTTWMVREEDLWFPTPNPGLGSEIAPKFVTTLITPKGFTAIANGRERACTPEEAEPGMDCAHFETNTGIDFATFNIGRDLRVDKGESMNEDADRDGKPDPKVPIRVYTNSTAKNQFEWVDPENPALVQKRSYSLSENGPDAVGHAQIARKVYTEWFGPCPYDTLMITPHPKGHGRGSASLLLVWQDAFLSGTAQAEWASLTGRPFNPYDMTAFLVHEIAHQWWGGAVRIRGDRDQWFSEGFSDYAAALVLEELDRVNDTKWFWGKLEEFRRHLLADDGYPNWVAPLCLGNRFASSENRRGFTGGLARQNFMYSKGSYVMHMLRMLARARASDPVEGDKLFKQAMHDFVNECVTTGRAPSNVDMERILSKAYGMPLDWFFDQWIYGMGVPRVDWSYQVVSNPDGTYSVKGHVKQKDTSFQFPLAVSFYKGKDESFGYTWIGKKETDFTVGPLPFKPDRVAVNVDEGVLGIFTEAKAAAGQ